MSATQVWLYFTNQVLEGLTFFVRVIYKGESLR